MRPSPRLSPRSATRSRTRAAVGALGLTAALLVAGCTSEAPPTDDRDNIGINIPAAGNGKFEPPVPPSQAVQPNCEISSLRPEYPLPQPASMPAGTTMAAIAERGRLVVGLDIGSNLLSFRDPVTGEIDGFDAAIARRIAQAIFGDADRIEFRILSSAERIAALQSGDVDVIVKSMSVTCARLEEVNFSTVYLTAQQRILGVRGKEMLSTADLANKRVCVARGSTSQERLQQVSPSTTIISADSWSDCLVILQERQADAVSTDDTILAGLASQDPNLIITGPVLGYEPYGVGIPKGDDDLVRFVNGVLETMRADGSWNTLYNKWFRVALGPRTAPIATYSD